MLLSYVEIYSTYMLNRSDILLIEAQLKQFGCSPRAADIYIRLLMIGPATVQAIAHSLKQNRVTIHSAIEQLIEKGLVYETRKKKKRLIVAEKPAVLYSILQRKENELQALKTNLRYVTDLLSSIQTADRSVPTVQFYEGVDGFKRMLEQTLTAKGEVLVFTYVELFSKLIGVEYLEHYYVRRAQKKIHTRLIFPTCPFAERVNKTATKYHMRIRLLPPELHWRSGIFSWNDSIAIQSFTEGKLTCTVIENKDIAYFYRHIIFELLWNQARSTDS